MATGNLAKGGVCRQECQNCGGAEDGNGCWRAARLLGGGCTIVCQFLKYQYFSNVTVVFVSAGWYCQIVGISRKCAAAAGENCGDGAGVAHYLLGAASIFSPTSTGYRRLSFGGLVRSVPLLSGYSMTPVKLKSANAAPADDLAPQLAGHEVISVDVVRQHHIDVCISRKAFFDNILYLRELVSPSKLCVVLKSNAYGHGLAALAPVAVAAGADYLGICTNPEAATIRNLGLDVPIFRLRHGATCGVGRRSLPPGN